MRDICPASPGAKDWQPSAFSPQTGLLYIPHQNLCMDFEGDRGELHRRHALRRRERDACTPGPGGHRGEFTAWDPVDERRGLDASRRSSRSGAARSPPRATSSSTARWTAGSKRSTRAPASSCGSSRCGSGIIGQPVTYRGPDGKQYVAILVRRRRLGGAIVAGRPRSARRHRGARASSTR